MRLKKWSHTSEQRKQREIALFIKKYLHGTQRDRRLFAYCVSPDDLTFLLIWSLKTGMVFDWKVKKGET